MITKTGGGIPDRAIDTLPIEQQLTWDYDEIHGFQKGVFIMLNLTITLLIIALVAALLGFSGIAGAAAGIAKIVFVIFLVLFVLSFLFGRRSPL